MRYDALYARQSVDKPDSISVESQLAYCRYETHGGGYETYADRGFSGKDTHRPDFERMMSDLRAGRIGRVIVYKLDRISRSILDFSGMMQIFQQYQVEFVSSTEKFDTSTPIGRAMLHICIVFAQLERETIQKRVSDAYYARSKRGFYMGGRVPYGFALRETVIDGVRTSMYEPVPAESEQVRLLYTLYADPAHSLGDIIRHLNRHGIPHLRGGRWSSARISEILRNPVYVRADAMVYAFFRQQEVQIISPISDFTGWNACYLYKGAADKPSALAGKELVLAPHEGIISADDWLRCRARCLANRQSTQACKAKSSWLCGKVKCARCGYALTVARSDTRWQRYLICSTKLATKGAGCPGTGGTVYAELVERCLSASIRRRLAQEFQALSRPDPAAPDPAHNKLLLRLATLDSEISDFLTRVGGAGDTLMRYINERVEALDAERRRLLELLQSPAASGKTPGQLLSPAALWDSADFADRQAVTDALVEVIRIGDGVMEIVWRI